VSQVRRNVAANFAGQIWSALMAVIFIPAYIHLLGVESFGLVGFFLTLQALAVVFDFGLAGTINRELARRGGGQAQSTRDLVRTLEWIYWPLGAAVALAIWAASGLLAAAWLRPVALSEASVGTAVALMGAAVGGLWPSGFYAAGLNGLQRQVLANGLVALFGTLRGAGVLLPLLLWPTIEVFFAWQAVVGLLQSLALARGLWRRLPVCARPARFSTAELGRVGAFTAGLTGIALLSFALMQADRILLSRLLPLDQFGVYVLAASVAAALSRLVAPWFNAMYPRYSELQAKGDLDSLRSLHHAASQWLAATVLPVAAVIAVFAPELLRLWTRDAALAAAAAPILSVLICGSALNGLMNLPYALQLAQGWTALALRANLLAVAIAVPAIWWLTLRFGPIGAAFVWLLLNLGYVAIVLPVMHRYLLRGELAAWYLRDVGPPALASVGAALLLRVLLPAPPGGIAGILVLLAIAALVFAAAVLATPGPRQFALAMLDRLRSRR